MRAIEKLARDVEKEAKLRNHEVLAAVLLRSDLCCPYVKVFSHMRSLERRIYKLDIWIKQSVTHNGFDSGSLVESAAQYCEWNIKKDELTKQLEDDRRVFSNLMRCGKCSACNTMHTPRRRKLWQQVALSDIFIAEGGEGE